MRKLEDEHFEVQVSKEKKEESGVKEFDNLYFLLKEIRKDIPYEEKEKLWQTVCFYSKISGKYLPAMDLIAKEMEKLRKKNKK